MFNKYFYNEGLRKLTVAFGTIFNNIQVKKMSSAGDSTIQSIRVPLAYGPKEKFLVRLDQQASLDSREFAVVLPRMSFEISGISYDASRKLTRVQKYKTVKTGSNNILNSSYTPVPYNINYSLNIFTATAENGLQIVEQILPYFQPDYTVTLNVLPNMSVSRDVPIVLNTVNYEDSYTGDFTTRRAVIYTLAFTAKTYLFGPASTQKVIRTVQSDVYSNVDTTNKAREERITVTPNPSNADADDDFGFTTTIQVFSDGRVYNKTTDSDE
jgi:aspartate-semialdehyde dehydrogenase